MLSGLAVLLESPVVEPQVLAYPRSTDSPDLLLVSTEARAASSASMRLSMVVRGVLLQMFTGSTTHSPSKPLWRRQEQVVITLVQ